MYESPSDLRDERRRRQLYLVFAMGMAVVTAICGVLLFGVLAAGRPLVRLGPESKFAAAAEQPVDIAVKRLETSKLIPNRPSLSEDVIFVVRDVDEFRAFLGTDPASGCFLSWRAEEQLFRDNCAQHSYGFTGRNSDQLATSERRPVNMVELPVTIRDGVLFVEDRILRRDLR